MSLSIAPPVALPARTDLLRQPHFHHLHQNLHLLHLHSYRLSSDLLNTLGLSRGVACQLAMCRCSSSRRLYQHRSDCYRNWCSGKGHFVLNPSVSKTADFLFFLCKVKHPSMSSLKGYHSTLTSVFKYKIPELQDSFVLRVLIHSFELERPL